MVTAAAFRTLCMALEGTSEAPHFDRTAFRVSRIYATLSADGRTANLKLAPDEQELLCQLHPESFAPVAGGWGRMGWTQVDLARVSRAVLSQALKSAWSEARPRAKQTKRKRGL